METLTLHTARRIPEKRTWFGFSALLPNRVRGLLSLPWRNDDDFVRNILNARVLSGSYFEIKISSLKEQELTLKSDCEISDYGPLKSGNKITNISHKKETLPSETKAEKQIDVITFTVGGNVFKMNSEDFKVVLRSCLKTSKTISLLCE